MLSTDKKIFQNFIVFSYVINRPICYEKKNVGT